MASQLFTNNAKSVLASSLTAIATSLTVTAGQGVRFPTITGSDYFLATLCQQGSSGEINFEVIKVTARSTDTFTIVRAQEGTTALAYSAGDKVELRLTKETMEGLRDFLQTGTGAVTRTVRTKLREIVSVLDFCANGTSGAAVDPTGAVDSTLGIQAAINQIAAGAMGGTVFFPPGVYLVSATLAITTDAVLLRSDDRQMTQIRRASNYGPTVKFSKNTSTRISGGGVFGIAFYDQNNSMTVATSPAHIVLDYTDQVKIKEVTTIDGAGGIRLLSANNTFIDTVFISSSSGSPTGKNGIAIAPTAISGATSLTPSIIWMNNVDMLLGTGVAVTNTMDYGLLVQNVDGLFVSNMHIFDTALADVKIASTTGAQVSNLYFSNIMLDHCAGYGVLMDGTSSVTSFEFTGKISSLGAGGTAVHGIAITSPCQDVKLAVSIEGFNASGIYIDNASANDIAIHPGIIRNNDADNASTVGGGIFIQQANRTSITGGLIGGAGKQDWGIRIGSQVSKINISGVSITDNGGVGIQIDASSNYINIVGCNLSSNPSGGLLDSSSGNTKLIRDCLGVTPIFASATWDPGSCVNGATVNTTIAVTGVSLGDFVTVSFSATLSGLIPSCYCIAGNVIVILTNNTGGATDLASMTVYVKVEKRFL